MAEDQAPCATIEISVAYAEPQAQWEVRCTLPAGSTVTDALEALSARAPFNALQVRAMPVGIWGQVVARDRVLKARDRLELYRPLALDPIAARRRRAQSPR